MAPAYVVRQDSSWCFRIKVPPDLRPIINKTELRYSLKTGRIGEAKFLARKAAGSVQSLFRFFERKGVAMIENELTEIEIQEMVDQVIRKALEDEHKQTVMRKNPLKESEYADHVESLEYPLSDLREKFALGDFRPAQSLTNELLEERNIQLDPSAYSYKKLQYEIMRGMLQGLQLVIDQRRDPFTPVSQEQATSVASGVPIGSQTVAPAGSSKPLSEIVEAFWKENVKAGNWKPRTETEYGGCRNVLFTILGEDRPIGSITFKTMREFKETLQKLPPFLNRAEYQNKSVDEILLIASALPDTDKRKTLSIQTINKHIGFANSVFRWAMRNHYMTENPAEGLQISDKKRKVRASDRRFSFNQADLKKLFYSEAYVNDECIHPHRFWLPLLGLFTGARLEELCQLHVEDVRMEDGGIWVLDINDDTPDKSLKTLDSKRLIPLHPTLVNDLRFPEYVARLKKRGKERVFPELKKIQFRYSHAATRWFGGYRKKCGIDDKRKTFHSFRHTFDNWMKQNMVERAIAKQLMGHLDSDMTTGLYGDKYNIGLLYREVISKMDFGVDLTHLAVSRFANK